MNQTWAKPAVRNKLLLGLVAIGLLSLALALRVFPARAYANLLLAEVYFTGIALCGGFFIALQYLMKGAWAVVFRRIPEAMTSFLPMAAALMVLIWWGHPHIYHWVHAAGDHLIKAKAPYLNSTFFTIRIIAYFSLWIFLTGRLVKNSLAQDKNRDLNLTFVNMRWSAAFMIVFALSFAMAGFDLVMSLEPHWFSTVFGVYVFAGSFEASLATLTLLLIALRCHPDLKDKINIAHIAFMAKLMLAFCIFWIYIWFSQFMLIWYSNLPEETVYYFQRWHNGWELFFYLNIVINWVVPFVGLLGYKAKRNIRWVGFMALVLLVGHWIDLYLMVLPSQVKGPVFSYPELGIFAGVAALFLLTVLRTFNRRPAVPCNDPLLEESIHLHE